MSPHLGHGGAGAHPKQLQGGSGHEESAITAQNCPEPGNDSRTVLLCGTAALAAPPPARRRQLSYEQLHKSSFSPQNLLLEAAAKVNDRLSHACTPGKVIAKRRFCGSRTQSAPFVSRDAPGADPKRARLRRWPHARAKMARLSQAALNDTAHTHFHSGAAGTQTHTHTKHTHRCQKVRPHWRIN